MLKNELQIYFKMARKGLLIAIAFALVFYPFLNKVVGIGNVLKPESLVGLFLSIVIWIYFDWDKKITENFNNKDYFRKSKSLGAAITNSMSLKKNIDRIRIIAATTDNIRAIIQTELEEKSPVNEISIILKYHAFADSDENE